MAQRPHIRTSRATVSPSTSTNSGPIPWVRENAFPLPHTPTNGTAPDEVLQQCRGTTKKGSRCKRHLKGKFYCHDHSVHPPVAEPIPAAEAPLTMNDILAKIPNLLRSGYYQCAGMSAISSRCSRRIKDESYCPFHATQLLYYARRDKSIVTRTIMQVKAHKGPSSIDDKLATIRNYLLTQRLWFRLQVDSFEHLLRNIKDGPLGAMEREQGVHTEAPKEDVTYVC